MLANNHYVVLSYDWDNGPLMEVGAVTWCDGETGCAGPISSENSLIGSHSYDRAGRGGIAGLANSNYVVLTPALAATHTITWAAGASWYWSTAIM
jgi:hypothetical protein